MTNTAIIGTSGESLAAEHLESQGWEIIARNVGFKAGELDLVIRRTISRGLGSATLIAFVEVKTRSAYRDRRAPERAVTKSKRLKVIRAAKIYLKRNPQGATVCRFDVVAVDVSIDPPRITHYANAFDSRGRVRR